MMEALQILKYSCRQERMSFMERFVADERDISVIDVDIDTLDRLMTSGRITQLEHLIETSYNNPPTGN